VPVINSTTPEMRFSSLLSFLAGAAFTVASPLLEKKDPETSVTVVYKNCEVTTPKVFIISMACHLPTHYIHY